MKWDLRMVVVYGVKLVRTPCQAILSCWWIVFCVLCVGDSCPIALKYRKDNKWKDFKRLPAKHNFSYDSARVLLHGSTFSSRVRQPFAQLLLTSSLSTLLWVDSNRSKTLVIWVFRQSMCPNTSLSSVGFHHQWYCATLSRQNHSWVHWGDRPWKVARWAHSL